MRLAILILAALAAFAQDDKLQVMGSVFWGSTAPTGEQLSIDLDSRYKDNVLIIRKGRDPIAFCNIRMGRCWDVKWSWERAQLEAAARVGTGTIRVYDNGEGAVWGATKVTVCCSGSQSGRLMEFDKNGKVIRETK